MSTALRIPLVVARGRRSSTFPAALRRALLHVAAWRAAKRREVEDREALATMSDRDLLDIGVSRASVDELAAGRWVRDWPMSSC